MTPIAHGFLLQFQPGILNATFMRFQCASMTASVMGTIATLWLP